MKSALIFLAAAGITLAASVTTAEETRIGVGVGPIGAGVTVGQSPSYERRTTVIKEREPRDLTVVIRKERRELQDKVIIHERLTPTRRGENHASSRCGASPQCSS